MQVQSSAHCFIGAKHQITLLYIFPFSLSFLLPTNENSVDISVTMTAFGYKMLTTKITKNLSKINKIKF